MHSLGEKLYSKKLKQKSQPQEDWCGLDFKDERSLVFKYEPTLDPANFLLLSMVQSLGSYHSPTFSLRLEPSHGNSPDAAASGPLSLISISENPKRTSAALGHMSIYDQAKWGTVIGPSTYFGSRKQLLFNYTWKAGC